MKTGDGGLGQPSTILANVNISLTITLKVICPWVLVRRMWRVLAILSILFWGVWGVLIKIAGESLEWHQIYFWSSMASLFIVVIMALLWRSYTAAPQPTLIALIAGVFGSLGYLLFIGAIRLGRAALVVPLTALYPAVTVVMARVFLDEQLSIQQLIGVVLAIIAAVLISMEPGS